MRGWHYLIVVAVGMLCCSGAIGQDPLGGASKPKPQMSLKTPEGQYKRIHQFALRLLLLDRGDEAEQFLRKHLDNHPGEPETLFLLGLLAAQRGELEDTQKIWNEALENGLPPGRIVAGPRSLLDPVRSTPWFKEIERRLVAEPIHGPLLGNVTDHSAQMWVRTAVEQDVSVWVSETRELSKPVAAATGRTSAQRDYTVTISVEGLKPDRTYYYAVGLDGKKPDRCPEQQRLRTFPSQGTPSRFVIAFGGGAGYVPVNERMWDTVRSFQPIALLLLGDNVYIDDPESVEMQQFTYYRRQSRPEFRRLVAQTAVFSIWDDHDFSTNDSWGGPLIDRPAWKRENSYRIWCENWANPGYGGGWEQPGCWYSFSIGDVDFFMLDCRYYRTNPRDEHPSMLGPVQMAWLKKSLADSRATFKVICSSVPWDFRTKGDSRDTWNGYRQERQEVFRFLAEQSIDGVLLMSADRHRSDAWRVEREGSYDLYEFNSSRLTNQHVHPTMTKAGALFSYNAKQSFGLVEFDTRGESPKTTYTVVTIDGEKVHQLTVDRRQLVD